MVGVQVAFFQRGDTDTVVALVLQTVLAQGSSGIVIDLIAIVHLAGIQHLGAIEGMGDIHALDGALLILVGLAPRDVLVPVQMRRDGVTLLILLNLEGFVATIGRVCQTFADDAVTHPHHELTVLGVAHLRLVHPKAIDTDVAHGETGTPQGVALFDTYAQRTLRNAYHPKGSRLGKRGATHTGNLTARSHRIGFGTSARG